MSAFAGALPLTIAFGAIALLGLPRGCAVAVLAIAAGICVVVAASLLAIVGRELTWPGAVVLACAAVCAATGRGDRDTYSIACSSRRSSRL